MNCISKRWWEMLYDVAKFLPNKYSFVFIDFPLMTLVQQLASQTKTSDIALTVLVYSIDEYNPGKTPSRISLAYGYMGSLFSGTAVPNTERCHPPSRFRFSRCVRGKRSIKIGKRNRKRKENATVPIIPFIPISFRGCVINSYWRGVTEWRLPLSKNDLWGLTLTSQKENNVQLRVLAPQNILIERILQLIMQLFQQTFASILD